jgi:hypothetical protein
VLRRSSRAFRTTTGLVLCVAAVVASAQTFGAFTANGVNVTAHVEQEFTGCSPGYWKNHKKVWDHKAPPGDYTVDVQWFDKFNDWFDVTPSQSGFSNSTNLYQVLGTGGGGKIALARHAAAALANADAGEAGFLSYPYSVDEVLDIYRDAVLKEPHDYAGAKAKFEGLEKDCPLGNGPDEQKSIQSSAAPEDGRQRPNGASRAPTEFEEWAGIGPLPEIPEACKGMTFDAVYVVSPRESTNEADEYVGTDLRYLIFGSKDDDKIVTGGGDDCIAGGLGDDEIEAGAGNDRVLGDLGDDRIWGGDGDDVLRGEAGNDRCAGGLGVNQIDCEKDSAPLLSGQYFADENSIILSWSLSPNAEHYYVYRSTKDGGPYDLIGDTYTAPVRIRNVEKGAVFYFVISAVDKLGFESAWSNQVVISTSAGGPKPGGTPSATPTDVEPPGTPGATPQSSATPEASLTPAATATLAATSTPEPTATKVVPPTATPRPLRAP